MDPVKDLLLRRLGVVFPPSGGDSEPAAPPHLVDAVELELLDLGYVLSGRLRQATGMLPETQLGTLRKQLRRALVEARGAGRDHTPLFQSFPMDVPKDTAELYVRRVLVHLYQQPEQPCLLCGTEGSVHAIRPCAHLVCDRCFDGSNYSACPICNRKSSRDSPFFKPAAPRSGEKEDVPAGRLDRLDLGTSLHRRAREAFEALVGRATPMAPRDSEDLQTLITNFRQESPRWLPDRIPVRETMAITMGQLLKEKAHHPEILPHLSQHLQTATDVLRVAATVSGGEPDLLQKPERFVSLPRALRKRFLEILEQRPFQNVAEDMLRHRALWKRLAEVLHPFEFQFRFPKVALACAALRRTRVDPETRLGRRLLETLRAHADHAEVVAGRLRLRSWGSRVEEALRSGDLDDALRWIGQRPGELSRRLDHLLRLAGPDRAAAVAAAFETKLPRMAGPILLQLTAHLRSRAHPRARRVFFPRGEILLSWAQADRRPLLKESTTAPVVDSIERELLGRAASLPHFPYSLLDAGLANLAVPFNERTTSHALIAVPRGSWIRIPEGRFLRLFLHWMEPGNTRVDLDLSVSLYDESWKPAGRCDYTSLRTRSGSLVHSGDFTSAPPPHGASEFIDVDLRRWGESRTSRARYAVMVVFSYNNVPFERLERGFAGFMVRGKPKTAVFDPRTVEQRFDLRGNARVCAPMAVDLFERRLLWMDANLTVGGTNHAVHRHRQGLGHMTADFFEYFQSGARPSLWDLTCLHAAARTSRIRVRTEVSTVEEYRRRGNETAHDFYRRVSQRGPAEEAGLDPVDRREPCWAALVRGDLSLPAKSTVYALDARSLEAGELDRIAASDLISGFIRT